MRAKIERAWLALAMGLVVGLSACGEDISGPVKAAKAAPVDGGGAGDGGGGIEGPGGGCLALRFDSSCHR